MNEVIRTPGLHAQIALLLSAIALSLGGTRLYARYALRCGITARINFRSLHKEVVPRGGGIVFATMFSATSIVAWVCGVSTPQLTLLVGIGGAASAFFGFLDDVVELRALTKIVAHTCLGFWGLAIISRTPQFAVVTELGALAFIPISFALVFVFVWFINLYNFIDGIDGMAASGSVFISSAAMLILLVTGADPVLVFILGLLAACSLSFLFFNLPPARIFMGDAGSIFLGYTIISLLLYTVILGQMSIWTWLAILSYYIGDTTVTGAYRVIHVDKWYGAHRSHAYQNLARIYDSHALVTYGVNLYNVLWALPMAFWTVFVPEHAPVAVTLALAPVVLWTLRFGPRLSSS